MQPSALTAANFASYPPRGRAVAEAHLNLLQQLPLPFLPSLLREIVEYDFKFPVEQTELDRQLAFLSALAPAARNDLFEGFQQLHLTPTLTAMDWCGRPVYFTEQLSAYLWQTRQMPVFRDAATEYGKRLQIELPHAPPPLPRLGIAVIGLGATPPSSAALLFKKLREHGTYFNNIDPDEGLQTLLQAVEDRACRHPVTYAHWYVDGGAATALSERVTRVSYADLAPVRAALLDNINREIGKSGMGPEELRDHLMYLTPADLGLKGNTVLDRFGLKILTDGSGTQMFSTTFAQWTAREVLRRAEAWTLLVRFQPRQGQRPMNELLAKDASPPQLDPQGSLVDADMASYYHWINQQRLAGSAQSAFLVWLEGQRHAVAIGPALPMATESSSRLTLGGLLALVTG